MKIKSWHTRQERSLIRRFGGKPLRKYGTDGILNGKPVEVKSQRRDKRFRIQKNVHETLVRKGGSYIFACPGHKAKKMSAKAVSRKLGNGSWYKDRKYPHKFLNRWDVW